MAAHIVFFGMGMLVGAGIVTWAIWRWRRMGAEARRGRSAHARAGSDPG